jgi:hypothetical protein
MWDFRFSLVRFEGGYIVGCVVWYIFTDDSDPDDGDKNFPRNTDQYLPDYTAQYPRSQPSTDTFMLPWTQTCNVMSVLDKICMCHWLK